MVSETNQPPPVGGKELLLSRLVRMGWLEAHREDPANCLRWTAFGKNRQILVRHVIDEFGLDRDELRPPEFTRECRATPVVGATSKRAAARGFWLACLEELELDSEDSCAWPFVQLIQTDCAAPVSRRGE